MNMKAVVYFSKLTTLKEIVAETGHRNWEDLGHDSRTVRNFLAAASAFAWKQLIINYSITITR